MFMFGKKQDLFGLSLNDAQQPQFLLLIRTLKYGNIENILDFGWQDEIPTQVVTFVKNRWISWIEVLFWLIERRLIRA